MTTPEFRTRPDGTVYPLTPPKPKGPTPGQVVGAVAVAVALAAGGGTVAVTGSSGTSGAGTSTSARSSAQIRDREARAVAQRLVRSGFRIDDEMSADGDDCAAHSYGQVQEFFEKHPCRALYRTLFEVRDRRGGLLLVAVARVDMPDPESARAFRELVDTYGTGNITELNRERGGYRHRNIRFTGKRYASSRTGNTVINAQAEPVGRVAVVGWVAEQAAQAAVDR
jgi:hypothetical protein